MKLIQSYYIVAAMFGCLIWHPNQANGQTWTACTNAPNVSWQAVASSADGTKLVAAVYGGAIYTSTNSGLTWISNSVPARNWYSVASSADGTKLAAAINILSSSGTGGIYTSTNGGSTWTLTSAPQYLQTFISIASSTNGVNLIATGRNVPAGANQIYTSSDSGNTWNLTGAPNLTWYSVASSADGMKLVAVAANTNVIYTSSNSGVNWTPNAVPKNTWQSVSSSADGVKLIAAANPGGIFTSTNSGMTWASNNVPSQNWYSVASASDGSKLVAVGINAAYTTSNSGQTWISNNIPAPLLVSVASSADGTRLIAAGSTGPNAGVLYVTSSSNPVSPTLSITLANAQLTIAWPASATGFQLQNTFVLGTTSWTDVTNQVSTSNNLNQVIVASTISSATFYRLKSQ